MVSGAPLSQVYFLCDFRETSKGVQKVLETAVAVQQVCGVAGVSPSLSAAASTISAVALDQYIRTPPETVSTCIFAEVDRACAANRRRLTMRFIPLHALPDPDGQDGKGFSQLTTETKNSETQETARSTKLLLPQALNESALFYGGPWISNS